jgi:hypothetical protein
VEGKVVPDATTMQQHLKWYYSGLVERNITERNISSDKIIPTTVSLQPVKSKIAAEAGFRGTVRMLDYMTGKGITLNVEVQTKYCDALKRTGLFVQVSPQPRSHAVWQRMQGIGDSFSCD